MINDGASDIWELIDCEIYVLMMSISPALFFRFLMMISFLVVGSINIEFSIAYT